VVARAGVGGGGEAALLGAPACAQRVEAMHGRLEAMVPERVFVRAYKRR